ncbi:DUF4244 domain-containing protein [Arthrobacter cavernae]|uniref:DUF4244 domain-containing protein n=1 Tax=Arthrobacter cavernae TaxID=2817681 RepID=UPI001F6070F1|nr:DUF4244 domain-containing protein [Arthrobacter cavernae]
MQTTTKIPSGPSATPSAHGASHTAPSEPGSPAGPAVAPMLASSAGSAGPSRPAAIRELPLGSSPSRAAEEPAHEGKGPGLRTGSGRKIRSRARLTGSELGMATAEYAIATLAAVGFAGLLVVILRSDEVRGFLLNLIRTALALP